MSDTDRISYPLVSVVIRSMDRATLQEALDSVSAQTYPNIEVVLVNAKGTDHRHMGESCGRFPMRFVTFGEKLRRSRAANAGLDSARGDYLIFLDDDDWFEPDHIQKLADAIRRQPEFKVVYTGVKCVDERKNPLTRKFDAPYDAAQMVAQNFIPIHALLFSRCMLDLGCRLDESLEFFEDWDFWIQMSRHENFLKVEGISAVYRITPQAGLGVYMDPTLSVPAHWAIYRKWLNRLSDHQITGLMETVLHNPMKDSQISGLHQAVAERDGQIATLNQVVAERDGQIATLNQVIAERDGRIATLNQVIAERDGQIVTLNQVVAERDGQINALLSSNSWRLTKPFRWCGSQVLRARLLLKAISLSNNYTGSPKKTFIKLVEVYKREGLSGVRSRVKFILERNAFLQANQTFSRPRIRQRPLTNRGNEVVRHHQLVDIVICVHNALDDVRHCLESVMCNTYPPYHLIIVDDGSGQDTKDYLEKFVVGQPATLIRNVVATGYTLAANTGMRASKGDFVVLLNSDTIVPPQWLDRLIQCANSSEQIGMAGPLSNTASWQSVPQISNDKGDWADNPLPTGWSVNNFANEVARASPKIYPRVGFLNGFCLLIKRKLIKDIGLFDEETFARGYGEENDYCLRATERNWQLAVADDCYVYHAQSKSYSHERRTELARLAGEALANKHGQGKIDQNLSLTQPHPALHYMRLRCAQIEEFSTLRAKVLGRFEGKRALFILPVGNAGGGGNIVLLEAACMRSLGVDAWIANLEAHRSLFEQSHPDNKVPVLYLQTPADLLKVASGFEAIIATLYLTVFWMEPLLKLDRCPVLGYYIQDFEPDFFEEGSANHQIALASYTAIPSLRLFTKTVWNQQALANKLGVPATVIGPSLDIDRFNPPAIFHTQVEVVHILAMVRPSSPRRGPAATMRVLKRLAQHFGARIRITIFGANPDDPTLLTYPSDFAHSNLGAIDAQEVASAIADTDIFLDCSIFQAMGLTAMEAMASGVAVVGPVNGGLKEIIVDGHNGILVNTQDEGSVFAAVAQLIKDNKLRTRIQKNALEVLTYSPVCSTFKILDCLFPQGESSGE